MKSNFSTYFKLYIETDLKTECLKLTHLVETIGRSGQSKESNLKKGIRIIRDNLKHKGENVTNRQIKNFISGKQKLDFLMKCKGIERRYVKISYSSHTIFEEIQNLIHMDENKIKFCQYTVPTNETINNFFCRDILLKDFYILLDKNSTFLTNDKMAFNTYLHFVNHKFICNKIN